MRKLTALLSVGGRTGSSMTMGLLERSGLDCGAVHQQKSTMNEKGFYEILEMQQFWHDEFSQFGHGAFMTPIPNMDELARYVNDDIDLSHLQRHKVDKYFTGDHIALKIEFAYPIMLFRPEDFEITTIMPLREIPAQAASVRKWNSKDGDFEKWLMEWRTFAIGYFTPDLILYLEEWERSPYETYLKLHETIKPPKKLTEAEVLEWFDPKLIHYK